MSPKQDPFASRVYVVGEVLIALAALGGGAAMVFWSPEESVKLVGSGMVSAVTALWFARRQGEQSNNALSNLADGKLTQLLESQNISSQQIMGQQQMQQTRTDTLLTMLAAMRKSDLSVQDAAVAAGTMMEETDRPIRRT